jgi:selenocysteine-specific elongation factor
VTILASLAGGDARLGRSDVARLPIDRAFTMKGFGTVVTGTLVSGTIAEGQELVVEPDGAVDRRRRPRSRAGVAARRRSKRTDAR